MRKIIGFIFFILGLSLLLGFGTWQIQRLQWKQEIIDQLDQLYASDPNKTLLEFDEIQATKSSILYGHIIGKPESKKYILLGPKTHQGEVGYHLISPVKLDSGGHVIINYGWIKKGAEIPALQSVYKTKLAGLFRASKWNRFTPDNSPENNIWTKADIAQIADHWNIKPVASLIFYNATPILPGIKPFEQKWYPRNKHKQYAIFWFTMALAYGVIFFLFTRNKRAV